MRITGGGMRGRRISPPPTRDVRPTPDAVRESLFNLLPTLCGRTFLDLFAGTGIVGIEALSRGTRRTVFVEKQAFLGRRIKEQLVTLAGDNRSVVLTMDIKKGLVLLGQKEEKFDFIFADPPYEKKWIDKVMVYIIQNNLLAERGMLILQRSIREPLKEKEGKQAFICVDERRYGDTVLTFMEQPL